MTEVPAAKRRKRIPNRMMNVEQGLPAFGGASPQDSGLLRRGGQGIPNHEVGPRKFLLSFARMPRPPVLRSSATAEGGEARGSLLLHWTFYIRPARQAFPEIMEVSSSKLRGANVIFPAKGCARQAGILRFTFDGLVKSRHPVEKRGPGFL